MVESHAPVGDQIYLGTFFEKAPNLENLGLERLPSGRSIGMGL